MLNNLVKNKLNYWLGKSKKNDLYLVGGTVRDLIMKVNPKDLDLTCKNARSFAEALADKKNAALVAMEKKKDEPCYRVVNKHDPLNFLDIAELRGETIDKDLKKRDFTINAMAIPIQDKNFTKIIDPLNGIKDIEKKIIKKVSDLSFVSDPLRILRAIRFAALMGFKIDSNTQDDMQNRAVLLKNVSAERIVSELMLILSSQESYQFFKLMDKLSILKVIFPEILPMKGCIQNDYHHTDVWNHSLLTMKHCEYILNNLEDFFHETASAVTLLLNKGQRQSLLKFAALFHDIGKPYVRNINDDTGRITFYGHEKEGTEIIYNIINKLRFSNKAKDFISILISEHMHVLNLSGPGVRSRTIKKWICKFRDDIIPIIILSMADRQAALGSLSSEEERSRHLEWSKKTVMDYYNKTKEVIERKSIITGNDLIAVGLKPGPYLGKILKQIRQAQDEGIINNKKEAMEMVERLR
ncbi:CCA tRNA nucleotidyltransferase [Candidatus Magnetomoraceae bacterium gMMP-15]